MMKARQAAYLVTCLAMAGCATPPDGQPPAEPDPAIEDAYAYLKAANPPEVRDVRFREPLRWEYLNDMFVTLETNNGIYLIEFRRICRHLGSDSIYADMADVRRIRGMLRVGVDTIRGCRIRTIYDITDDAMPDSKDDGNAETE